MIDIAIICSTFPARKELLRKSLETWTCSISSSKLNTEIFIYENGMNHEYNKEFPGISFHAVPELSGSHITGYNYWLDRIEADKYIFTHPDLLFPKDTVQVAYETAKDNVFAAFKVFWMPQQMTEEIEKYDWKHPETLEKEIDLYPLFDDGHGEFYWNGDVRSKTEWHATTTWAMNHKTLQKLRPLEDFGEQGPDDPWNFGARSRLMIEDVCVMDPILFHQWHPQTWDGRAGHAVNRATQALNRRFG